MLEKWIDDSINLPFTYFGTGKFENPHDSVVESLNKDGTKTPHKTILLDIILDNPVPEDYWFDFEIPDEKKVN